MCNTALTDQGFKEEYGNVFLIETGSKVILYDVGLIGEILENNLKILNKNFDDVDVIIFSHGHFDHTGALKYFLTHRTSAKKIDIIAHPDFMEPKGGSGLAKLVIKFQHKRNEIGFDKLSDNLMDKVNLILKKEAYPLKDGIITVGEISNRKQKDGTQMMTHLVNGKWEHDPLNDDNSVIIKTKDGLVLLCGCCHAGILNTCYKIKKDYPDEKIVTIIGGTHMFRFSKTDLNQVADVLEKEFDKPLLYLNHCSGKKAIKFMEERFGSAISKPFHAGSSLEFEK